MARLTMAQRRALPKSAFAVPSKAPGAGSYPMPDAAHARAAVGLATMHGGPTGKVGAKAGREFGVGRAHAPRLRRPGRRS